jgi:hypothetical protein
MSCSLSVISCERGLTNVGGIHPKVDPSFLVAAHQPSVHLMIFKISFFLKDNNPVSEEEKSNMHRTENMTDSGFPEYRLVSSDSLVTVSKKEGVL